MAAINHSGSVPYLHTDEGLRYVLITNRRGLWGFPKGLIEEALTPWDSAAKEAGEEAGIVGRIRREHHTVYRHRKWSGIQPVGMYLLQVDDLLESWDEDHLRGRTVLPYASARETLRPELVPVLDWAHDLIVGAIQ